MNAGGAGEGSDGSQPTAAAGQEDKAKGQRTGRARTTRATEREPTPLRGGTTFGRERSGGQQPIEVADAKAGGGASEAEWGSARRARRLAGEGGVWRAPRQAACRTTS